VRGLSAWLTVGEPDASGELTLRAVDAAGQSVATLDGARLKTPDGQLSAPIRAGTLQVAGPLPATGVQLLLPDGRCLPLDPVGKPAA
jgi:hypothetical protein